MTKKKMHEEVLALCDQFKAPKKLRDALSDLTAPKVGGSSDVNDYTIFDEDGNVTHIFCTYHKKWEPVSAVAVSVDEEGTETEIPFELFVKDEKSKNGFRRYCDEGDKQWKEAAKVFKTSEKAIMQDVLDEKLSGADAKAQVAALQAARDVHPDRTDGLGTTDRPGAPVEESEDL